MEGTIKLMESAFTKPINIGSDRLVTINQLADIIIQVSGKKISKKYDTTAAQGVRGRNADLTLVRTALQWEPLVSLEEGLQQTYKWIEKMLQEDSKITPQK